MAYNTHRMLGLFNKVFYLGPSSLCVLAVRGRILDVVFALLTGAALPDVALTAPEL